jgi:hypothetical protein
MECAQPDYRMVAGAVGWLMFCLPKNNGFKEFQTERSKSVSIEMGEVQCTNLRCLVRMPLDVLVATVSHDKLDDCLHVIRARLEYQPGKNIGAVSENQHANQFVDERLCSLNTGKIESHLESLCQINLHLFTQLSGSKTRADQVAACVFG